MSAKPTVSNEAVLRFSGPLLIAPMLERVVGMLVARVEVSIDKLEDAMLLTDAIAAHAPDFTNEETTMVIVTTNSKALELSVGPFDPKGAKAFIASSELPEVGNVIERLTSDVQHEGDRLSLTLDFGH